MKRFGVIVIFLVFAAVLSNAADSSSPKNLTLTETLNSLNARLYWDSFFQSGIIMFEGHNASFQTGVQGEHNLVLYDNERLLSLPAPFTADGKLYFPEEFVVSLRQNFDQSHADDAVRFKIAAIMIDPGHGGKDAGAKASHTINGKPVSLIEKDITLAVSKNLYEQLKSAFPNKKILISRTGDTYPTLENRVAMANSVQLQDNEAIIYISIHANASFNKSARGFEVWYLTPDHNRTVIDKNKAAEYKEIVPILNDILQEEYNRESFQMAAAINKRLVEAFGSRIPSRGLKAEDFLVVRKALMPSVLVELAFVTNEADAMLLTNANDLKKFADSIYKGIVDFVQNFEESGGFITF